MMINYHKLLNYMFMSFNMKIKYWCSFNKYNLDIDTKLGKNTIQFTRIQFRHSSVTF